MIIFIQLEWLIVKDTKTDLFIFSPKFNLNLIHPLSLHHLINIHTVTNWLFSSLNSYRSPLLAWFEKKWSSFRWWTFTTPLVGMLFNYLCHREWIALDSWINPCLSNLQQHHASSPKDRRRTSFQVNCLLPSFSSSYSPFILFFYYLFTCFPLQMIKFWTAWLLR